MTDIQHNVLMITSGYFDRFDLLTLLGNADVGWLGGVVVRRWTCDHEILSSAGAFPGSLGQLSLPSLRGR